MINKIILASALVFAMPVFADSSVDLVTPPPAPTPAPAPLPTPDPAALAAANAAAVNAAAQQAMAAEKQAAMMNMMASAALMTACMASHPPATPLCIMGAMAAAQGGADTGYAGQSANTADASNQSPIGTSSTNPTLGEGGAGYDNAAIKSGQTYLNDAGYTVGPNGVTGPDGTVTPSSTFSSPASMAAAGIDQSTIAAAQKALASVNQGAVADGSGAKVSSVGVSEGTGGAGGNPGNFDGSGGNGKSHIYNPFALTAKDKKAMAAGKTVMFDGDPIGVKGQNLFDMVHVAYDRKRQHNHFIETGSGVTTTSVRAPPSLKPSGH